jgi:hypothetical protein
MLRRGWKTRFSHIQQCYSVLFFVFSEGLDKGSFLFAPPCPSSFFNGFGQCRCVERDFVQLSGQHMSNSSIHRMD